MTCTNHIQCTQKDISSKVLLPWDPQRAKYIAENYLEKSNLVAKNREFFTYTGYYKEILVTVCSTGIGCPSTAIVVEELIDQWVDKLIRVGTCGWALKKEISPGNIVIPTASIREEWTTKEYFPSEFPAVADYNVVKALENAASNRNFWYYIWINRTHDAFYGSSDNIKKRGKIFTEKEWLKNPILSSEMESSALFIIATLRWVQAGAVLAVNGMPEDLVDITLGKQEFISPEIKLNSEEAQKSVDRAIIIALDALISL